MRITGNDIRRGMRPTLADKIASAECIGELTGMYNQIVNDGRMGDEIKRLIAKRKAELERGKHAKT